MSRESAAQEKLDKMFGPDRAYVWVTRGLIEEPLSAVKALTYIQTKSWLQVCKYGECRVLIVPDLETLHLLHKKHPEA